MLEVNGVSKAFGGLVALQDCSFRVEAGSICGLIGPNGSGKSTLFNVITGFYRATAGSVAFRGRDITGLKPDAIARLGLVRTFQLARPLGSLSVLDNLLLAAPNPPGEAPWAALLRGRAGWERAADRERAGELLEQVGLAAMRDAPAAHLSYGQQKLLALAAAVMAGPAMLLLDEPTAGVNPSMRRILRRVIRQLRDDGLTFLIVEHDMGFVMSMCDRVVVLDHGLKIAEGTPAEVRRDPAVVSAYLGA